MASTPTEAFSARRIHTCPECGNDVPRAAKRGRARVFCTETCKQNHNNRMASRGKALAKIALGWRHSRGSGDLGKFLFAEMTSMLDAWNSEDRTAGRMRADHYAGLVVDFTPSQPPLRYMDRKQQD